MVNVDVEWRRKMGREGRDRVSKRTFYNDGSTNFLIESISLNVT